MKSTKSKFWGIGMCVCFFTALLFFAEKNSENNREWVVDIMAGRNSLYGIMQQVLTETSTFMGEIEGREINYSDVQEAGIAKEDISVEDTEEELKKYNKTGEQYSLIWVEDGYELTFYDKENEKVDTEWYPLSTHYSGPSVYINEVTPDLLKISFSVGSPAVYIHFFDKCSADISPEYFNPIIIENKYAAYMEEDALVISDIFQRGEVYTKMERDFAGFANPIGAVSSIELLDDKRIKVEYYEGDNRREKTEEIVLE